MATLNKDWLTEKHIDFEYKKYVLLAYLKTIEDEFQATKLYPSLSELFEHYKRVRDLKDGKQQMLDSFPARLQGFDFEKFKLSYEKIMQDDGLMQEIETIINFSIPQFEFYLNEGKKIYDFVEEHIHISPVGLMPLYPNHGYMFLKNEKTAGTKVYEYQITIFEQPEEKYRGINTRFITSFEHSITNTFESIKNDLIRANKNIPNPATFAIESDIGIPVDETFLPIAKRTLVRFVAKNS